MCDKYIRVFFMKKISYLVIPSITLVLFIIWTILVKTVDVRYVPEIGFLGMYSLNTKINIVVQDAPTNIYHIISHVLLFASFALVLVFFALAIIQWVKRELLMKVDKIFFILLGTYVSIAALYLVFELMKINFSPLSVPGDIHASYPSSHVFIFISIIGSSLIAFNRMKNNPTLKKWSYVEFALLVILMSIIRLFSGHHYFSDIIGGILLGLFVVSSTYMVDAYVHREEIAE